MKRILAALTLALLLSLPVHGGSADDPEVTDPAGDLERSDGLLVGDVITPDDMNDVDILAAWVNDDRTVLNITVMSAGDVQEGTEVVVEFTIDPGPTSLPSSTANGTRYAVGASGTTVADGSPGGTTVAQDGNLTTFEVPLESIGAVGGDVVADIVVFTHRFIEGDLDPEFDDQDATDRAPDEGTTSASYTLDRDAPAAGLSLTVLGGSVTEDGEARAFNGAEVTTTDPGAAVTFDVQVENTGTDSDTVSFSVADASGLASAGVTVTAPDDVTLDPGATETVTVTVALSAADGTNTIQLRADSAAGASRTAALSVTVQEPGATTTTGTVTGTETTGPPGGDEGRDPVLDAPFLTKIADSVGLTDAAGDWAEVIVLAILILLLILLLLLILFLARGGGPLELEVRPKAGAAAPGETAEYEVHVRNRKGRAYQARLHFDLDDHTWKTGVLLTQEEGATLDPLTSSDQELEFTMNGKLDPGNAYHGTLRIKVPEDAADGELNRATISVVPVDEEGVELAKKKRQARVRVESDHSLIVPVAPEEPNVRLAKVEHDPIDPEAGEEVRSTVKLENDDEDRTWVLRVVLNVDGEDIQQQVVAVPPLKARAVIFTWTAKDAENHVRLRVFEKTRGDDRPSSPHSQVREDERPGQD